MNGRAARMHRSMKNRRVVLAERRRQRRDAWLAFLWHTAELALVVALLFDQPGLPRLPMAALVTLAVIGWAWSLGHLPGQKA